MPHLAHLAEFITPSTEITPRRQALIDLEALRRADRAARPHRARRAPADASTITRINAENQRNAVGITRIS